MVQYAILVVFKDMFDVTVSSLFKKLIMEELGSRIRGLRDLITMEMVEWDFILTSEDMDLHVIF